MGPAFLFTCSLVLLLASIWTVVCGQLEPTNLTLTDQISAILVDTLRTVHYEPAPHTNGTEWTHLLALQNDKTLAVIEVHQVPARKSASPYYRFFGSSTDLMQLVDCTLFDMKKREKEGSAFLEELKQPKNNTSFAHFRGSPQTLLNVGHMCRLLWKFQEGAHQVDPFSIFDIFSNPNFIPGTLWCGPGDRAGTYWNLGIKSDIDACCREHDHCPVRLAGQETAYGEVNPKEWTVSWCECDRRFKRCLNDSDSDLGRRVWGFFEYFQGSCLESLDGGCKSRRSNGTVAQPCSEQFRLREFTDERRR